MDNLNDLNIHDEFEKWGEKEFKKIPEVKSLVKRISRYEKVFCGVSGAGYRFGGFDINFAIGPKYLNSNSSYTTMGDGYGSYIYFNLNLVENTSGMILWSLISTAYFLNKYGDSTDVVDKEFYGKNKWKVVRDNRLPKIIGKFVKENGDKVIDSLKEAKKRSKKSA